MLARTSFDNMLLSCLHQTAFSVKYTTIRTQTSGLRTCLARTHPMRRICRDQRCCKAILSNSKYKDAFAEIGILQYLFSSQSLTRDS